MIHPVFSPSPRFLKLVILPWLIIFCLIGGTLPAATKKATHRKKAAHRLKKSPPKKSPRRSKNVLKLSGGTLEGLAQGSLDLFFRQLDALEDGRNGVAPVGVVRILHFGDSHVAADFWTGELRRLFQANFGDAGPGYVMPGRPWSYFRHAVAQSAKEGEWKTIGLNGTINDGLLGLSGVGVEAGPGGGQVSVQAECTAYEVMVANRPGDGCPVVLVDGECVQNCQGLSWSWVSEEDLAAAPPSAAARGTPTAEPTLRPDDGWDLSFMDGGRRALASYRSTTLPPAVRTITVEPGCGGPLRVLGMTFYSGRPGVMYDTLGLNGVDIVRLEAWEPEVRRLLMARTAPALIIISYGTNDIGQREFSLRSYKAQCRRILERLKADAPGASILVTGPIDRSSRYRRVRRRIQATEGVVVEGLREAALQAGCAYWDARAAMGGSGSIYRWAANGMAQRDYVHLTGRGYDKLAGMLYERLMQAYSDFKKNYP